MHKLSVNEIKRKIRFLESLDARKTNYESYFEYSKEIISGLTTYTLLLENDKIKNNEGYGLFRAREVEASSPFTKINDFWGKPSEIVNNFGRCNKIGESVLYLSNHFATCLIECRAKENTKWVLTEYELKSNSTITLIPLGVKGEKFLKSNTNPKSIQSFTESFSDIEKKKNNVISTYLRKSFKQVITKENIENYKKTTAYADLYRQSEQAKNVDLGVMFPSVASGLKGVNFAIASEIAMRKMLLKKAYYLILKKIDFANEKIEVSFLAETDFTDDKVEWIQILGSPFV